MKLSQNMYVTSCSVLAVMLAGSIYGIWHLQSSSTEKAQAWARNGQVTAQILSINSDLKTQVQEWKNVLLRGKDDALLNKHWSAFEDKERAVSKTAQDLRNSMSNREAKALLEKFSEEHQKLGAAYRKGLQEFKNASFDPAAGDAAVKGIDRAPTELIGKAVESVQLAAEKALAQDIADMRSSFWRGVFVLLTIFAAGAFLTFRLVQQILRVLGGEPADAVRMADAISAGDLTTRFDLNAGDQKSLIARLIRMQGNLAQVVSEVRQNAEGVATASAQIAQGNGDLAHRTEVQASSLQKTASSMEQLSSTVKLNADNAKQANHLALGASTVASKGGEVVGQVVDTMKGINESSRKIADIISVIDGIAFQTNILALNAAVEAARAGEQGRGFAVVASEVRSLAQRSAEAAKEIKTLISASVDRVEQGTSLVDQAGDTMNEVVRAIRQVTDIMGEINMASGEQSLGVAEVNQAVTQMDSATQQNAALVEQSAAAAENLRQQAEHLVKTVAMFRCGA